MSTTRRQVLQTTAAVATLGAAPAWVRAQSEPWRIGQTAALTGPLAFPFVEMNKGIAAAFKEVNDKGGVEGRAIEFTSLDDGGSPEKAAVNTLQLVQKNQVFSMFACGGTTSVMGALKVLEQAKVPLIAPATGSDALRPYNPLVFHTRATYGQELNKIVRQLGSTGFTKCAVAYFDNPFGKATLAAFEAAAREHKNTDWKAFLIAETPEGVARSRCNRANLLMSGCSVVSGWSNSTMPMAPITLPASSRSGMRLTTKVPARLVSRSISTAWPVSSTRRICVFGITSSTVRPTNWSTEFSPRSGRKRW